ncbi:sigma-54-dependent transcriptional regulator [Paraferrimonas sedimenticola]|uniref:Sigma-54-dependent Fis family transcriptional regulator n=1 Tax=Paraferrimonas sedimenticola TaxID=375674 RepID=A0AA37VSV1_9GAMM|nr:sigma-54 dependent transcriptional regulator [Paraferrimonas sedimenticola]GLP94976.1 sigma-54-dependent Fis family transcriptional regulator [Paraferrimonas sedimenticola]
MADLPILLVEDDAALREALVDTLELAQYPVIAVDSAEAAVIALKKTQFGLVVSDVQMGAMDGVALLGFIQKQQPQLPVLLMTAYAAVEKAVEAMKLGAKDYLQKPFSPQVLLNQVERYLMRAGGEEQAVVADEQSQALLKLAQKVAKSDASVMITGPSGSGKEVLARYLHQHSSRNDAPFVAINCAAIPENMLEATLFGYEKGAYTGAHQACPGKFEQAQDGTLLLDEVSEMDLGLQAKLLRVLQEREVERLGGRKVIPLNVRVLATSNRDLKQYVDEGKFREDLYYRLNVFPLAWPALCERPGDILPLARHLLEKHCQRSGDSTPELSEAAARKLLGHRWPGNVRELDNVVQRALILRQGDTLDADDIVIEGYQAAAPAPVSSDSLGAGVRAQEHQIILETLNQCQGSRKAVAEKLGISSRTLRYKLAKMREAGIEIPA